MNWDVRSTPELLLLILDGKYCILTDLIARAKNFPWTRYYGTTFCPKEGPDVGRHGFVWYAIEMLSSDQTTSLTY